MLSEKIRELLDARISAFRDHPLLELTQEGRLPPQALGRYIGSTLLLIQQTVPRLDEARKISVDSGRPDLAEYFARKFVEETGHDAWAEADLSSLSHHYGVELHGKPLPAAFATVDFIEGLIARDPQLYLVYMLTNEYLMVSAGPAWLNALTTGSGAPVSALTVIAEHIEADQDHTDSGFAYVDRLLSDSLPFADIAAVIHESMDLFEQLCSEVAAEAERDGAVAAPSAENEAWVSEPPRDVA